MILKRQLSNELSECGSWEYIDKIENAQVYQTQENGENGQPGPFQRWVHYERCGEILTVALNGVAYLLSDEGKTIERI